MLFADVVVNLANPLFFIEIGRIGSVDVAAGSRVLTPVARDVTSGVPAAAGYRHKAERLHCLRAELRGAELIRHAAEQWRKAPTGFAVLPGRWSR